jgi:selenocysteine-specific elongation factor
VARLVGTAGHVDHGKTALIRALTHIDADRLPEEKLRGLTIDIGFAHLDLPGVGRVSIVDVPGHERFVSNMLVGALGVSVALLCVAADASVMPQTREHLQILDLLPVQRLVVALTRCDLADETMRAVSAEEVRELLAATRFKGSPIVETSAVTGDGLEALKAELARALAEPETPDDRPWALPIDRVFTVKGHGTVVTGTLVQGRVATGAEAAVEPGGLKARIKQIQGHDTELIEAVWGQRAALNLVGVKAETAHRGMVAGAPGTVWETQVMDAQVRWIAEVKHGATVRVAIGADDVVGRVFLKSQDPLLAQFRFARPTAAFTGQPLIVRRHSPAQLLGGGKVVRPVAEPRRRNQSVSVIQTGDTAEAVWRRVADGPGAVSTEEVCRSVGQSPQALGPVFERLLAEGRLLGFAGAWFTAETLSAVWERFHQALLAAHAAAPTKPMVPRESVAAASGLPAGKPLDRILAHWAQEGRVRVSGTQVGAAEFKVDLPDRQRALLERVKAALDERTPSPPGAAEIAQALRVPPQAVTEIVRVGLDCGELVRLEDGVFFTPEGVEKVFEQARAAFAKRQFTASEFREAVGTTRKFAIPLLEWADSRGLTLRRGDSRVFVAPG